MATPAINIPPITAPVEKFLADVADSLRARRLERLRLSPLLLRADLDDLLSRRKRLFDSVIYESVPYGYDVKFERHLKRSRSHPEGRVCAGTFQLVTLTPELIVVASTLVGDDHRQGPLRFIEKAYPLARRPFFSSVSLVKLIEKYAEKRLLTPLSLDAMGYHRKSRRLRRDMDAQSPAAAAREMAEQGRQLHRMLVRFDDKSVEVSRFTFDRSAALTIIKGNPTSALKGLMLAGVSEAVATMATYEIARTVQPTDQESVELSFADDPFDSYDAMLNLCAAVREGDGLNVSVVHLNPYLQAQVLDFFTGAAVEMLVTDLRTITLIPRSGDSFAAIERIATTIYRYFGEAKAGRAKVTERQ